jgi:hypothetical protein
MRMQSPLRSRLLLLLLLEQLLQLLYEAWPSPLDCS